MHDQCWHLEENPSFLFVSRRNPKRLAAAQIAGGGQGVISNGRLTNSILHCLALRRVNGFILFIRFVLVECPKLLATQGIKVKRWRTKCLSWQASRPRSACIVSSTLKASSVFTHLFFFLLNLAIHSYRRMSLHWFLGYSLERKQKWLQGSFGKGEKGWVDERERLPSGKMKSFPCVDKAVFRLFSRWKSSAVSLTATKIRQIKKKKTLQNVPVPTEHLCSAPASEHAHHSWVCLGTSHLHEIVALTTYVCPPTGAESCWYLLLGSASLPDMLDLIVVKTATQQGRKN